MADFVQDTGWGTRDAEDKLSYENGATLKRAEEYSFSVAVQADPTKRVQVGYVVPDGLRPFAIREVPGRDIPAEWLETGQRAGVNAGYSRTPDFIGIHNDNGKPTLFLAWN